MHFYFLKQFFCTYHVLSCHRHEVVPHAVGDAAGEGAADGGIVIFDFGSFRRVGGLGEGQCYCGS